eukprot:TRINITY_DN153_c0_g1_i1.p1 TRINITY_DN153_c0_g1~~TRINITY_DN153_c0_g1_i1.p1  ORF type:complete len:122 (-),score=29.19 TRINITY_DN153_c0_g1_i1:131-496(-)
MTKIACDIGHHSAELEAEYQIPKFEHGPAWWYHPVEYPFTSKDIGEYWSIIKDMREADGYIENENHFHKRVQDFKEWLHSRSENNIAVFSHRDFLERFTKHEDKEGRSLNNAELFTFQLFK